MVRQKSKERGLTQEYVAARLQIEEARSITQSFDRQNIFHIAAV
jgi:hypothetical protein